MGLDNATLAQARRSVRRSITAVSWAGFALNVSIQLLMIALGTYGVYGMSTSAFRKPWDWVGPAGVCLSATIGLVTAWSYLRSINATRLARGFLAIRCCASCGYSLLGLDPEPDGCTVCPECGSAWKFETGIQALESALIAQSAKRRPKVPPSDSRSTSLPPDQAADGYPSSPFWDEVNEAIPIFLGAGRMSPAICPDRLIEHVGAARAAELEPFIRSLVNEMFAIPIDWKQHDLVSGTNLAIATVEAAHPQLSPKSLHALGGYFSWSSR